MAATFVAGSSQRLTNTTAPLTAVPFTVGMWMRAPADATLGCFWSLSDTAGNVNWWQLYKSAGEVITTGCNAGAGSATANVAAGLVANGWTYVMLRAISATNRRLSVLHANGLVEHAQSTTSRTPAGVDVVGLGSLDDLAKEQFFTGSVAEYFMANVDVQPGGTQLQNYLLWQFAYGGPFSVPHIARNIVDYRPLRESLGSDQDHFDQVWSGGGRPARRVWTNTNGVTLGAHPPLPPCYVSPFRTPAPLLA